jgi:hypothetical protein
MSVQRVIRGRRRSPASGGGKSTNSLSAARYLTKKLPAKIVKSGVKVEPARGAYDSANEEYANAVEDAFKGLLETKKAELHFINMQLENLRRQK